MDRLRTNKLQSGEVGKKPTLSKAPDIDVRGERTLDPAAQSGDSHAFTRRKFLLGGGAMAVGAATDWPQFGVFANFFGKPLGELDYHARVGEFKDILEQNYGITLVMGPQPGQRRFTGEMFPLEKYTSVMEIIAQELSFYPPEMIREIGKGRVFEIRVVDNFYVKGPFVALQSSGEAVKSTAVAQPIAEDGMARLYFEANESESLQRRTIHHDLNHFFAAKWENWDRRNEQWTAFHKKVSAHPYTPVPSGTTPYTPAPPDKRYSLTYYASSAAQEDEAVCTEWMMTPLLHFEFRHRIENEKDENVRDVLLMKYNQTIENYRIWSRGKIDKAFWEDLYKQGKKEYARMAKNG